MFERLRTFVVVAVMTAMLAYITLGATLVYMERSGGWEFIRVQWWCPQVLCKAD